MTEYKKNIRGILFDLDGTLLDTAPDMINALNLILNKYGLASVEVSAARSCVTYGAVALLQFGFGDAWSKFNAAQLRQEYLETYAEHIYQHTSVYDGFTELEKFMDTQNITWGIVTNKPANLSISLIEKIDALIGRKCLIAADTLPIRKPHSPGLLMGAELISRAPQQCAYIGDSIRDIEAARSANMFSVAAKYGYIRDDDNALLWGADSHIDSLLDLIPLIEGINS